MENCLWPESDCACPELIFGVEDNALTRELAHTYRLESNVLPAARKVAFNRLARLHPSATGPERLDMADFWVTLLRAYHGTKAREL